MDVKKLIDRIPNTLEHLEIDRLGRDDISLYKGKVRDVFSLDNDKMILLTSDRISAFDRVLTTIPCKGEVLNRISLFWFKNTEDIISNHIIKELSPRSVLVKKFKVLPIEVVLRGYLTGSAWRDYKAGKAISGIKLPDGMKFNQKFPEPLLTPSTKEEKGKHDLPISREEILAKNIVPENLWKKVEEAAFKLFKRGTEIAAKQGLILVDTKYEFGVNGDDIVLIDEVHTPDSSRFWYSDTYSELFNKGEKQRKLDKEFLRQWLMDEGFMGDGDIPHIPDEIRAEVAMRYIKAYEEITGETFESLSGGTEKEAEAIKTNL